MGDDEKLGPIDEHDIPPLRSSLSRGRCKGNEKRVNNFRSYISVSLSSPSCLVRSPFDVEKRARGKGGGLIRDGDKGGGNCL